MFDTSYLSLLQDRYTTNYNTFHSISDISSLLANKKTDTSSSDYSKKIVDIAESDAQTDIKNGNTKSWQNSESYLKLKDEYVEGSSDNSYSNYSSLASAFNKSFSWFNNSKNSISDSYLSTINNLWARAMNESAAKQNRAIQFDFRYNQAYNAYKSNNAIQAQAKAVETTVDISV